MWRPIVDAGGNNWYAFIHVDGAAPAWLCVPLGAGARRSRDGRPVAGAGEHVSLLVNLDSYPDAAKQVPSGDYDQRLLTGLLEAVGHPTGGTRLTTAEAILALRAHDGPLSGITEQQLSRLLDVNRNHGTMLQRFTPRRFKGTMLLFAATVSQDDAQGHAATWAPYVDGQLEVHEIPCDHDDMLSVDQAKLIATIVAAKLDQAATVD